MYTTLDRLEQKGYVRSWLSDPTRERGGRAKRYFEITGVGEKMLKKSVEGRGEYGGGTARNRRYRMNPKERPSSLYVSRQFSLPPDNLRPYI